MSFAKKAFKDGKMSPVLSCPGIINKSRCEVLELKPAGCDGCALTALELQSLIPVAQCEYFPPDAMQK